MKSKSDLHDFYQNELLADLKRFEESRLEIVAKLRNAAIVLFVIALVVCMFILRSGVVIFGIIPIVLSLAAWVGLRQWYTRSYRMFFKTDVLGKLVKFIDESLEFKPKEYITREVYDASMLFSTKPDKYKGEDLVKGQLGKTKIAFSELHTQYTTRDSKGRTQTHTIFKGLFFLADFNKDFQGYTLVLPDYSQRLFGSFGQKLQGLFAFKGQLVKLEDLDFEKRFVVYASDQVEARYILTPSLMQRLTEFAEKTKKEVRISFVHSSVFVAISLKENLFEPRIYKTLLDFSAIEKYYDDLLMAIGIVEELNLNCRIWTKQ